MQYRGLRLPLGADMLNEVYSRSRHTTVRPAIPGLIVQPNESFEVKPWNDHGISDDEIIRMTNNMLSIHRATRDLSLPPPIKRNSHGFKASDAVPA